MLHLQNNFVNYQDLQQFRNRFQVYKAVKTSACALPAAVCFLFLQKLCKLVIYSDKFWQKDTFINFPSPACLIFFVKFKTGNLLKKHGQAMVLIKSNK
jgi:hypothetical protein